MCTTVVTAIAHCTSCSQANNHLTFNPLYTGNTLMGTLANSEDPDEMQHNAAFHQGLHCLLRLNNLQI